MAESLRAGGTGSNRVTKPGGEYTDTDYLYEGNPNGNTVRISRNPTAASGTVNKLEGFGGFGRRRSEAMRGGTNRGYHVKYFSYNQRGLLASETQPAYLKDEPHYRTKYTYDALNRLTQTKLPDGATISTSYWNGGASFNRIKVTDELGRDRNTHKDAHGRTVLIDRFLGNGGKTSGTPNSTHMAYDHHDRLIQVRDPANNTWTYTYDALDRRLTAEDPNHGLWTFVYDRTGLLTKQTDANGAVSEYRHDGLGRVVARDHKTSAGTRTRWHTIQLR